MLPTAIAAPTQPGTVMGTAGYMSPEQASGQPVDFRSDQFTLGAILYEMATGKRAFQRKTGAETLVAIIREEPEPLSQLAPKAPGARALDRRALLAKDPEERYASTQGPRARPEERPRSSAETSALRRPRGGRARRKRAAAAGRCPRLAALAVGIAAGFLLRASTGAKAGPAPEIKRLTFARGAIRTARFAPDGQTIVYAAAWEGLPLEIFTTRADSSESRSLGLPGADLLAISSTRRAGDLPEPPLHVRLRDRSGRWRAFRSPAARRARSSRTWRTPTGRPTERASPSRASSGNRSRIEYPIGKVLYDTAGWVSNVRVSPDGRLVAFIDHPQRGDNNGNVKVVDTSGKVRLDRPVRASAGSPGRRAGTRSGRADAAASRRRRSSGKTRTVWIAPGGVPRGHRPRRPRPLHA